MQAEAGTLCLSGACCTSSRCRPAGASSEFVGGLVRRAPRDRRGAARSPHRRRGARRRVDRRGDGDRGVDLRRPRPTTSTGRRRSTTPIRSLETPSIERAQDGWVGFNTNTGQMFQKFAIAHRATRPARGAKLATSRVRVRAAERVADDHGRVPANTRCRRDRRARRRAAHPGGAGATARPSVATSTSSTRGVLRRQHGGLRAAATAVPDRRRRAYLAPSGPRLGEHTGDVGAEHTAGADEPGRPTRRALPLGGLEGARPHVVVGRLVVDAAHLRCWAPR